MLRQAAVEEAGGEIGPAEEEQQEQQMETDDVEAPEVVPEAGQDVSEVWTSFSCCIYF